MLKTETKSRSSVIPAQSLSWSRVPCGVKYEAPGDGEWTPVQILAAGP